MSQIVKDLTQSIKQVSLNWILLVVDFLYKPLGDTPLKWYAGVGPYAVFGDPFTLGVVGEVGLEYRFDAPISVSADWRPAFSIIENTDFHAGGFGLNVRYIF